MNAQQLSRKLGQLGFTRSTWSRVKGRGRSRRSVGFQVVSNQDTIEVSVNHWNQELVNKVHDAVIELGLQEVEIRGHLHIYKNTLDIQVTA
jgi:nitrogen regulatory protein PII